MNTEMNKSTKKTRKIMVEIIPHLTSSHQGAALSLYRENNLSTKPV